MCGEQEELSEDEVEAGGRGPSSVLKIVAAAFLFFKLRKFINKII